MASFAVKEGQFWIDDRPQLIQAGEFHYFRTPADQWRHRLGLLQAAGFSSVAMYIPWLWHETEEGQTDFDGRSHPMRDLSGFLDLAAEMGLWIIARPGPYIMAETINEGVPPWVFSRYPQAAFVSRGGEVQNIASYLHPDFRACAARWLRAVFAVLAPRQVTRGGRIIMVQLDNEMGMMQWVRNIMDANPDTIARFAAYLRGSYGDRLARRYPEADLEAVLRAGILNPQEPHAAAIVEDYRRFYRAYLHEYAAFLVDEAKACGLEVPPVINVHGFANGGKTFPIGLSQLIDVIRMPGVLTATDVYPGVIGEGTYHQLLLVNEMTKALQNEEQALFSIEFQAGGTADYSNSQGSLYDLHARLCFGSGMRAINHYLFCSGENDPVLSPVRRHDWGHPVRKDGTLRRHYFRYGKLSRALAAYESALTPARPETVTTIGFGLDDFMTEVGNEFTQQHARVLTHQREVVLFDFIARGLALTHRPFDAVDLSRAGLDPARRPVLWVMLDKQCAAGIQGRLADYARQGGRLVVAGRLPEEDIDRQPCTLLKDALGVEAVKSDPPFARSDIRAFGYRDVPASFVETYAGQFDEVFAARGEAEVVGFVKAVGRGKVMLFGAALTIVDLEDLDILDQMALAMDCQPAFRLSEWADVRLSRGEAGSFLFINNYQDDPVETTIEHRGQPLFGGQPVHVAARQGVILPLDWQAREGVLVHYATSEIVEAAEDGRAFVLKTARPEFAAELTLAGYRCEGAVPARQEGGSQRVRLAGKDGVIVLTKDGA